MDKETLREEIERIWGPYSEQARSFRVLLREYSEIEARANCGHLDVQKVEAKEQIVSSLTSNTVVETVESATMAYFFTRAMFIIGSWIVFIMISVGGIAALLFFYT
mgnify:CR=1 FL=1